MTGASAGVPGRWAEEGGGHVSGSAAEVEDAGLREGKDGGEDPGGATPPGAVEAGGEEMVEAVVAGGDGLEHALNVGGGGALVGGACGAGSGGLGVGGGDGFGSHHFERFRMFFMKAATLFRRLLRLFPALNVLRRVAKPGT